jgi:hypothetical protein
MQLLEKATVLISLVFTSIKITKKSKEDIIKKLNLVYTNVFPMQVGYLSE